MILVSIWKLWKGKHPVFSCETHLVYDKMEAVLLSDYRLMSLKHSDAGLTSSSNHYVVGFVPGNLQVDCVDAER